MTLKGPNTPIQTMNVKENKLKKPKCFLSFSPNKQSLDYYHRISKQRGIFNVSIRVI